MQWPAEHITAFCNALSIDLHNGTRKEEIVAAMLDWAMRRIVWRAGGDPARVEGAMRSPYTPLGSVVGDGLDGRVERFTLKGDKWGPAVHAWHDYVEEHAVELFEAFEGLGEEYDDKLS